LAGGVVWREHPQASAQGAPPRSLTMPSSAMLPNIQPGARLRIEAIGEPRAGDVVAFRFPQAPESIGVLRVIGLPGDSIELKKGIVYWNGQANLRQKIGAYQVAEDDGPGLRLSQFEEVMFNGTRFKIVHAVADGAIATALGSRVPPGHYYLLGDNRDDSFDSRHAWELGYLPRAAIIGRVVLN
jgi:signal peptidase I